MSCKLSIIVPVFKVELYLHKCIDSILAQTFTDFELILVDDGSPDLCGEICDEYTKKDKRIRVVHKENGGLSSARNAGLDIAMGEYVGFIDSDDYIEKDMYETLYNLSKEYDADVVECAFTKIKKDEAKVVSENVDIITGDNLFALNRLMSFWFHSLVCTKLYKKNLFSKLRFPEGKIHEDEFIMHRIFFSLKKYVYLGTSKYLYIQREGSIMQEGYSLKTLDRLEGLKDRFYYLEERINDKSILDLVEYRYFMEIVNNYFRLNDSSKLDLDRNLRKNLRCHVLHNRIGFMNNKYLRRYRKWIVLINVNGSLFEKVYKVSHRIAVLYYSVRCKCTIFIKKQLKNISHVAK